MGNTAGFWKHALLPFWLLVLFGALVAMTLLDLMGAIKSTLRKGRFQ